MEIKNFTDCGIRLGEFPHCLDITNIDGYHSNDGIKAFFFSHKLGKDQHFMQVRKRTDLKDGLVVYIFKYEEQLNNLPEYVGDVVFDSRYLK